jgi:dTMP kinase
MDKRGKFIVIEGGDAAGKKTQANLALGKLQQSTTTTFFDFPRYEQSMSGKVVREALDGKFGDFRNLDPHLASLPYTLDRVAAAPLMWEALNKGNVLCNRYTPSNSMYQGGKFLEEEKQNEFIRWLERLEYEEFNLPRPSLLIYLHVPFDISQKLMADRQKDQHEQDVEYLKRVVDLYLRFASRRADWKVIECIKDGNLMSREEIHALVIEVINAHLKEA